MSDDAKATAIFDGDDSRLQSAVKRIDESLEKTEERFKEVTKTVTELFLFEKGKEGAEKLTEGIREVLEVGAHFHDLSQNAGVVVGEMMAMDQQFKAGGKDAAEIIPTLSHMQKILGEGTENSLINELGVDLDDLRKKNPVAQFEALGKAIGGLKNPTDRSYAAMQLFGKEGVTLLSLFKDAHGFEDAAEAVGSQAEILNADAAFFSAASTKLGEAGLKTQGFFVGVADEIVPVLMPLLDRMEHFDGAKAGQEFGMSINTFAANDDIAGTIVTSLLLSGANFIEFVADGLAATAHSFGTMLEGVALAFVAETEKGLGKEFTELSQHRGFGWLAGTGEALTHQGSETAARSQADSAAMATWVHTGLMDGVIDKLGGNLSAKDRASWANAAKAHAEALAEHPEVTGDIGAQELMMSVPNVSHLASLGGAFGQVVSGGQNPIAEANDLRQKQLDALIEIRNRLPDHSVHKRSTHRMPE